MVLALLTLVQALIADLITPIIAATTGRINALMTFLSVAAAVFFMSCRTGSTTRRAESARAGSTSTKRPRRCPTHQVRRPHQRMERITAGARVVERYAAALLPRGRRRREAEAVGLPR